jgi:hypothetical protein
MSQVLKYGFPTESRLLCENPVCEASATTIALIPGKPGIDSKPTEICGCQEHINRLVTGRRVIKFITLKVPGQHNAS